MGDNLNGIFANMIQGMGFIGCAPNRVYNMAPPDGGGVEATAEGTDLSLHSAASPLTALTLYGKSEQETTTGAQLFDFVNADIVNMYISNSGIGDFVNNWSVVIPISPNTGYTISEKNQNTIRAALTSEYPYDGIQALYKVVISQYDDIVIPSAYEANYLMIQFYGDFVDEPDFSGIMLNAGDTALPWEPYTGGAPSPSPDYPQEIKSVGDSGTINVSLSDGGSQNQTLPVQTPNGLPGIPVSSGGNYTDANGQQWICDEVDFKRGVYVQRVKKISDIAWRLHTGYTVDGSELFSATNITDGLQSGNNQNSAYCSKLICDNNVLNLNMSGFYQSYGNAYARIKDIGDIDSFLELMQGAVILYQLETPVETTLSPSDIAAYSALRTYSPTTVVSNDAGAWMRVGYKATPQPMTMLARKR